MVTPIHPSPEPHPDPMEPTLVRPTVSRAAMGAQRLQGGESGARGGGGRGGSNERKNKRKKGKEMRKEKEGKGGRGENKRKREEKRKRN